MTTQPITLEQLARLYGARNAANADMSAALRVGGPRRVAEAKAAAGKLNIAYEAARKAYKRQQKAANHAAQISFYLDALENQK